LAVQQVLFLQGCCQGRRALGNGCVSITRALSRGLSIPVSRSAPSCVMTRP